MSRGKEGIVEAYLTARVRALGGFVRKVVYQGRAGAPDRWCFFPGGRLLIVEVKARDGVLSQLQKAEISILSAAGFEVGVAYSKEDVDRLLLHTMKEEP